MKHWALLLTALCGALLAAAEFKIEKDLPFLAADRMEKLDLYLPETGGDLRPAVVMIHGGSWKHGTKNSVREINICGNLAKEGFVAASIEYKLARNGVAVWPDNLHDCRNAVRFLRKNAAKYRIDPEHIGVIGASAGGHLALMLALTDENVFPEAVSPYPGVSCQVSCCINLYGVTSRLQEEMQLNSDFDAMAGKVADASLLPVNQVKKSAPPVLTIHGTADKTVQFRHAGELDRALTACGASSELLLLADVGHVFNMEYTADGKPLVPEVKTTMLRFLHDHLTAK